MSTLSHPAMMICILFVLLLAPLVSSFEICPSPTRYDVRTFPPKCIPCPTRISAQQMNLSRVETKRHSKTTPVKFSPGLPQNQTCGCWRGLMMTVDVEVLSPPWIVAGLSFAAFTRAQWVRTMSVFVSDNGTEFMDWGTYTQANHTSTTVVFQLPVRARYFRLNIISYVNHLINDTSGFPLLPVYALAANTTVQPFVCACPTLPDGTCCPDMNMAVRGGVCVRCVDPRSDVHAVDGGDGCGRCVAGTVEMLVRGEPRCVPMPAIPASNNAFTVDDPVSDGVTWSAVVNVSTAVGNVVAVFVDSQEEEECVVVDDDQRRQFLLWDFKFFLPSPLHRCMLPQRSQQQRQLEPQYIQFDRGRRYVARFNESAIRRLATFCDGGKCTMRIRAVFVSDFGDSMVVASSIRHTVVFDLSVPSLILRLDRRIQPPAIELHLYGGSEYRVRLAGVSDLSGYEVRFDDGDGAVVTTLGTLASPPPPQWQQLRLVSPDGTVFATTTPSAITQHNAMFTARPEDTTRVSITYGFGMKAAPEAGDSEQIVSIRSTSTQPIRLKRLAASDGTVYTNTRGFIVANTALDLVVSCAAGGGQEDQWLMAAMGLLPPTPNVVKKFARDACAWVGGGSDNRKALWVVPTGIGSRRQVLNVTFVAEFG